ncbi:MAG: leucine-rich repeat domain-containing protein [Clostridia bacterium]|nr:leucine-rich repeat domain-containing protein [Clostridia bacterium]
MESDSSVEDSTSGDSNSDSSLESDGGVEDDSTNSTDSSAEPVETGLTFKTLTVNGTDAYGKFSNATEEFSFDNEIQTSGNSSYVVSNDKYGSQTYLINVVPLNCGENVYYIFEKSGTTVLNRFTITLYRRSMCTVTFNTQCSTTIPSQTVEEDSFAVMPETELETRIGATFNGWNYDFATPITKNTKIQANWLIATEMSNFYFTSTSTTCHIFYILNKNVTQITVPDYVTSIEGGAFSNCSTLEEITIPFVGHSRKTANDVLQLPFGHIFGGLNNTGSTSTKQYYYGTSNITNTTFYIPTSLKKVTVTSGNILYGAFYNCKNLTTVILPSDIENIGQNAFFGCTSLTEIVVPDNVKTIGENAFAYCENLTHVELGENLTSIDYSAFAGCTNLTSIVIPNRVTNIGTLAFDGCTKLTSIVIPNSVTNIGSLAFAGCDNLTIYCEAESKPDGWDKNWNSQRHPVEWGYTPKN